MQHVHVLEASGLVETSRSAASGRAACGRPACRRWSRGSPSDGLSGSGVWTGSETFLRTRLTRDDRPRSLEVRREYPATVDRVFANWADPHLKRRWFSEPENQHDSDFRVGETEINRGTSPGGTPITHVGLLDDHDRTAYRRQGVTTQLERLGASLG